MMLDHNEAHRDEHVLDESLNRLAATGPEFGGGLSNHGPMGAEALVRLGRPDDVDLARPLYPRARGAAARHKQDYGRDVACGAGRPPPGRRLGPVPAGPTRRRAVADRAGTLVAAADARPGGVRDPWDHPHLARRAQPGRSPDRRTGR